MTADQGTTLAPMVSICLPTYNGREHLKECLEGIRSQTFRDFEVVICDDQSTDGTLDFAREMAQQDERFRFIENPRRLGLVGNWNHCISESRGQWIKFVFQDDLIAPTCVEKLLKACESTGKPFSFCSRDFVFEDGVVDLWRSWFANHKEKLQSDYQSNPVIDPESAARIAVGTPTHNPVGEPIVTLINKSVFRHVGTFDEALIQLCDSEFWMRVMISQGAVFVPESLAVFRVHAKSTTAVNHGERAFRMEFLDPLVVRYRLAFDRHFSNLRLKRMAGQSKSALRNECAVMAFRARRQLWRAALSADKRKQRMAADWKDVAAHCPGLGLLAMIGFVIAGYRHVKRAAGTLISTRGSP